MVEYNPSLCEAPDFSNAKVVVLDVDGFLVDTYLYEFMQSALMLRRYDALEETGNIAEQQEQIASPEYSQKLIQRIYAASAGSNGDPVRHYQLLLGQDDLGPNFPAWHEDGVEVLKSLVRPFKGATELLGELAASDKHVAMWTSRERKLVRPDLLQEVALPPGIGPRQYGYFDMQITADDVGFDEYGNRRLKPHTAGMEIIAQHFGVDYGDIVMGGDRPSDAACSKLGCMTLSLASGFLLNERQAYWQAGSQAITTNIREIHQLLFPDAQLEISS